MSYFILKPTQLAFSKVSSQGHGRQAKPHTHTKKQVKEIVLKYSLVVSGDSPDSPRKKY